MTIADKAVLVTGANRDIWQALVDEALSRGATRVYAGTRQPLTHPDRPVTPLTLDVTNPAQIQAAATPEASRNVFRREGEYWTVVFDGSVVRLRDAKGLRHLSRLLAHPGREFHAVDLEAAQSRPSPAALGPGGRAGGGELAVRRDLGDAGALLDATAKAAYRARLTELRAELEEAE